MLITHYKILEYALAGGFSCLNEIFNRMQLSVDIFIILVRMIFLSINKIPVNIMMILHHFFKHNNKNVDEGIL